MSSKFSLIKHNRLAYLASGLIMGALVLSGCMSVFTSVPAPERPPKVLNAPAKVAVTQSAGGTTISVATDPKLGKILVGEKGMTLYIFTKDGPNQSNCTSATCLQKWQPLTSQGTPTLGAGVDASLLGTANGSNGAKIVTYNKMPLYYFLKDQKAGDTMGQGFGGFWYAVSSDGKAVDSDSSSEAPAPAATMAPAVTSAPDPVSTTAPASMTLSVATDAKLGKFLVGPNGMTLYMFTLDGPNQSNCNADCIAYWPPLLSNGSPTLGAGVDASLVGSANLPDGTKIVTYNKIPLYFFVKDAKPGDILGQGFAKQWYVVSPDGKAVDDDASSATPAAAGSAAPAVAAAPAAVTATVTITEPTINIATVSRLGKILVGDKGMTLYIFTKDTPDKSNCTAACLQKWLPVKTLGKPSLGAGVDASLFSTASLADGSMVLTYNKMPLYYFSGDSKAGDTKGEGFAGFWFVISPLGKVVPLPALPTPKPNKGGYGGGGGGMGGGSHY
jgi:predicted lipoprotein with Yx(FWY)xxD motif